MRFFFPSLMMGALVIAAGCATVYEPKPGEPVARVRMASSMITASGAAPMLGVGTNIYDVGTCPNPQRISSRTLINASDADSLGMPSPRDPAQATSIEFVVPAGKPLGALVHTARGRMLCSLALTFTPAPGGDYEFHAIWDAARRRCMLDVSRLVSSGKGAVAHQREPSFRELKDYRGVAQFCPAS